MKRIINLDEQFQPLNATPIAIKQHTFSGGEPHITILDTIKKEELVSITCRINSFNDLGILLLTADAAKRQHAILDTLVIPYFPGARQDRVMNNGEPLTVKVYADIINKLGFKQVVVFDPHSDVTPALVNNVHVASNHNFIVSILQQIPHKDISLVSPDGGALKKIYKLSEFLNNPNVIECSKHRDTTTGKLNGFKIYDEDFNGQDILLVDDICDGGGTFIGVGTALQAHNIGKMYLAVSHGIFSKGTATLEAMYEKIFVTDSVRNIESNQVIQVKLNEQLLQL